MAILKIKKGRVEIVEFSFYGENDQKKLSLPGLR